MQNEVQNISTSKEFPSCPISVTSSLNELLNFYNLLSDYFNFTNIAQVCRILTLSVSPASGFLIPFYFITPYL